MDAKYTKADGTVVTLTKAGKVDGNIIPSDNTKGLGSSCRTTFTMTADGTLDFYTGATGKTFNIYYVGINAAKAIEGDENGDGEVNVLDINAAIAKMAATPAETPTYSVESIIKTICTE